MTTAGYRATREQDGTLTIHRVPIFVECQRGDFVADEAWIRAAVQKAKLAEANGYMPPLHIRHHREDVDVKAAGFFRVVGAERIEFQGEQRLAVMADLVITDPGVQLDILAKRLPYRSVEIFDCDTPSIDSLALLDHEAPYLELPMLMVRTIDDRSRPLEAIAYARVAQPASWRTKVPPQDRRMVACFRRGTAAHLLFQDASTMTENEPKKPVQMEGEPPPAPAPAESPAATEGSEEDTGGEDGKVSKAAMIKVLKALLAMFTEEEPKKEEAPDVEMPAAKTQPTPANVPGQALQKDQKMNIEMAKLAGELEAMKGQLAERDRAEKRRDDVATAMQRLANRPLGADLETRLVAFHTAHGAEAFAAHVDSIVATFALQSNDLRTSVEAFGKPMPAEVLAFQAQGSDAMNRAARFAAEHDELARRGMTRVARADYVKINMDRFAAASN